MTTSVPSFFRTACSAALSLLIIFSSFLPFLTPETAHAAGSSSTLEYSGWIPYWKTTQGAADAKAHINQLTEVNPFGYTVKTDGTLYDAMGLSSSDWQGLFSTARASGTKIVPTVMWSDTDSIYNILSNQASRTTHIQSIVNAVKQNNFDGIDIDYEAKSAETRDSYSQFLRELSSALHVANPNAQLDCTIEARMPLSARYSGTPPSNIEYANDLPVINQYCDRVRIMTYDQETADLQLNASHSSELYSPVSDPAWVTKVVNYMAQDISKSKMVIGVATYGYIYQAMTDPDGQGFTYTTIEAFNPQYGIDTAAQNGIVPSRNSAGELSFSYVATTTNSALPSNSILSALAPSGTASANLAAVGALNYTKNQSRQTPVTFLDWSDSQAIADKASLAKSLGVAGIAIFKVDGGEDPKMWSALQNVASRGTAPSITRITTTPTATSTTQTQTSSSATTSTTQTTTAVPGCFLGALYSTTTGQPCPAVTTAPVIDTVPVSTPTTPVTTTTTSTKPSAFTKDLTFGASGTDVTKLQAILIKKGYLKVKANGNFGPATLAALKAWQKAVKLPSTGFFGPQSRALIGS